MSVLARARLALRPHLLRAPATGILHQAVAPLADGSRQGRPKSSVAEPYLKGEHRNVLRTRIQDRMPPKDDCGWPEVYKPWLTGADKVVIPGRGPNWLVKALRGETMDLLYTHQSWARLQEPYRNMKLFTLKGFISSDVIRRLCFPDLAFVASIGISLTIYNSLIAPVGVIKGTLHKTHEFIIHSNMICLPHEHALILSVAIGLLVTFRTQTSYNRYDEAKRIWYVAQSNSREICSRIMSRIPQPRSNAVKFPHILVARNHGAKLAWSFSHALRYHLTYNGCNMDLDSSKDEVEEKRVRLRDELKMIWDYDDAGEREVAERILHEDVVNWPHHICHELTYLNGNYYCAPHPGGLGHPNSEGLDGRIMALQQCVSDAERIIQTPIYTPYTRFTNRVIFMFVCSLPAVLYPIMGPWLTTPFSCYISFVLLGIDDIGRRVEEPFDNLPLWEFCQNVDRSCEQLIHNAEELERSPIPPRPDGFAIGM